MTATQPQCSIALWRGYVSAQFYARHSDGWVLCLSPTFRTWRLPCRPRVPIREDAAALAALEALRLELRSRGWVRMRREAGSEWYEGRFRLGRRPPSVGLGGRHGSHRLAPAPDAQPAHRS